MLQDGIKAAEVAHSLDGTTDLGDALHQGEIFLQALRSKREKKTL